MWINGCDAYIRSSETNMRAFITLLSLLASTAALAQNTGEVTTLPGPRADFVALDRNRDGYISKVEALANPEVHKRFAAFDRDRDGRLSEAEYVAVMEDNDKRILEDSVITVIRDVDPLAATVKLAGDDIPILPPPTPALDR